MSKNNVKPEIRFKNFTDAWEQRNLGAVTQITMGQSPSSANYTDNPEDYILVQGNADMKDGRVTPRVWTTQITKLAEKNDLILSVRAPVGDIGKTDYNVVLGRGVAAIKGNEFIFQLLGKMKQDKYWTKLSTGSTFESINSKDIQEAVLMLPNRTEQKTIGEFFLTLDNAIALHQHELTLLKQRKKAFLQKMFPKKGESIPKISFPIFTKPWESKKIGDLMDVTSVKRIHQSDWTKDGVRFLRARDIVANFKNITPENNLYISEEKYKEYSRASGKVSVGDLLVTGVGSIGIPMLIENDDPIYFKDGNIIWFKNNDIIDANFLYYSFIRSEIQNYIRSIAGIGTVGTYTITSGKQTPIKLPSRHEQQKIGNFFKQLDEDISLHEQNLEKLKEMKKAFLQKMFV